MSEVLTRNYIGEVDYFAVYCPATKGIYLVPCDNTTRGEITLRLRPTANCQDKGIRWAADYALHSFTP